MAPQLFAWQAWHLATSTSTLRGRRGTFGTGLALVARLGTLVAATVCRPGVALGDIDCILRGVALMALDSLWRRPWVLWSPRLFAWQAWHLATSTVTLRGRRGTWRHLRAFCGAGVALLSLDWEWWRAWYFGRRGCLHARCGTW